MLDLSIIVPFYNEQGAIEPFVSSLNEALKAISLNYEMVFVNDGSMDKTAEILNALAVSDRRIKVVHFGKNYGQTAAMMAGIDHAQGEIIVAMDGDGQNDPRDIKALLDKMAEGYDVVSGWRKFRQDRAISRKLPSRIANKIISWVSGVN